LHRDDPEGRPVPTHLLIAREIAALRETPEQARQRTAPARAASIVSKKKAAAGRLAVEIADAEARRDTIADEEERAALGLRIIRARRRLAEVEESLAEAEQTA
jgi:hypothetical protein